MGKHRRPKPPKRRGNRKALAAAATAGGISCTLVLGHTANSSVRTADVALAASVISVGGRGDPTSGRVQDKLNRDYALGFQGGVFTREPIAYPASFLFQTSIDDGVPKLTEAVRAGGKIRVVAYSEGTLVAEQVKRNLAHPEADDPAPSPDDLDFVLIASPYVPNGGIFARFPGVRVPGLLPEFGAAAPTDYDNTYVTNEYDGFADFPAYFNPISIANAVAGMVYAHPDDYYDDIDLKDSNIASIRTYDRGDGHGRDTYVLVYNPHLPLLAPVRQAAALTHLTPLTEPALGSVEPLLRLAVDAGYTDRTNANPGTPQPFSFVTPPAKLAAAAAGIPAAVSSGMPKATNPGVVPNPVSGGPSATSRSSGSESVGTTPPVTAPGFAVPQRERIDHPTLVFGGGRTAPKTTLNSLPKTMPGVAGGFSGGSTPAIANPFGDTHLAVPKPTVASPGNGHDDPGHAKPADGAVA